MLAPASTPRAKSIEDLIGPQLLTRSDRLDVLSRKVFAGKLPGERRSKKRGASVEFDDYRNYVAGDDLRHIDWNVYARLDKFFIKLFREEEDLALHVVVDASASMDAGYPNGGFQPENALSRKEALMGMTTWAAKSAFEENEKGSLEAGKAADFIILDKDWINCPLDDILKTTVLATFINGEKVFGK